MKTIIIGLFTFLISLNSLAQDAAFQWGKSIGGSDFDKGNAIATDGMGNSYITGYFQNTVDFDPGPGVFELTTESPLEAFVLKLDADGNLVWAISYGNDNSDVGQDIEVDIDGNIYITGQFRGTVDFDPSDAVYELTTFELEDPYLLKLDADGNFLWVKSVGGGWPEIGLVLTTDNSGNVYFSGYFGGTADFDPGIGINTLSAVDDRDIFIVKLNTDGDFIWARAITGDSEVDILYTISVDNDENVYLGGLFKYSMDADPGVGIHTLTADDYTDGFLLKLDELGDFLWATQYASAGNAPVYGTVADSDGNIYVVGFFDLTVDFDPGVGIANLTSNGGADIFLQKLDADGNYLWAKSIGGTGSDAAYDIQLMDDELYISGLFSETVDFNPEAGVLNQTAVDGIDIFVMRYDISQNFVWVKTMGGTNTEVAGSIAVDLERNIFVTGFYRIDMDFDPGPDELIIESEGDEDIFIIKLKNCTPNSATDNITACISYTWINDITYYENNNTDTYTLTNITGCDSIITLDLTINEVDITTTAIGGTLTSNATGATYQWLDCNDGYSEIDGEINASFTPVDDGDYAVKVTIGECTDISDCIAVNGVGILNNSLDSKINIYPNPTNGKVAIELGDLKNVSIQIYSLNGQKLLSFSPVNKEVFTFDLNFDSGIYTIEITADTQIWRGRIVKE